MLMDSKAKTSIDEMLQSAVTLSWQDLSQTKEKGLISIEYAPGSPLEYLKIWNLASKGSWDLICEYWMASQSSPGTAKLKFSNGYGSAILAKTLNMIMQRQGDFTSSQRPGAGLLQVTAPSEQERQAASVSMDHFTYLHEPPYINAESEYRR
jgi:hypothetical protein